MLCVQGPADSTATAGRFEGLKEAVGAGFGWLRQAHFDPEIDIFADHHGLGVQIASRQIFQIEQRLRDDARDNAAIKRFEL